MKLSRRKALEQGAKTVMGGILVAGFSALPGCGGGQQVSSSAPLSDDLVTHKAMLVENQEAIITDARTGRAISAATLAEAMAFGNVTTVRAAVSDSRSIITSGGANLPNSDDAPPCGVGGDAITPSQNAILNNGDDIGLGFAFDVKSSGTSRYEQQFPGFFIRAGEVETHELRPCVYAMVKHIHLKVASTKNNNNPWFNLHLGKYNDSGRVCFVAYESRSGFCVRTCAPSPPSLGELANIIERGLAAGLVAAGIVIAAWIIRSAAVVLAAALYGAILAL